MGRRSAGQVAFACVAYVLIYIGGSIAWIAVSARRGIAGHGSHGEYFFIMTGVIQTWWIMLLLLPPLLLVAWWVLRHRS